MKNIKIITSVLLIFATSIFVGKSIMNGGFNNTKNSSSEYKSVKHTKKEHNNKVQCQKEKVKQISTKLIDFNNMKGKWQFQELNDYLTGFTLDLSSKDNYISGNYCILYNFGNTNDCPLAIADVDDEPSIQQAVTYDDYISFKIVTDGSIGIAKISLINNDTLSWEITTKISGKTYFPVKGTFKRII